MFSSYLLLSKWTLAELHPMVNILKIILFLGFYNWFILHHIVKKGGEEINNHGTPLLRQAFDIYFILQKALWRGDNLHFTMKETEGSSAMQGSLSGQGRGQELGNSRSLLGPSSKPMFFPSHDARILWTT